MPVDADTNLPKYQQLSRHLHEAIASGRFRPGARIPGDHQMAKQFGVSRITVRRAIAQLQKGGYVSRQRGRGTFVNSPNHRSAGARSGVLNMAVLYADTPLEHDHNVWQIRVLEQLLRQHNCILSVAAFDGAMVAAGKLPLLLQHGKVQGALVDGQVHDFHCAALERLGFPYVVLGNHPIDRRYPQVRVNYVVLTDRAVSRALTLRPNAPVVLMVEPFYLHYTREIYTAYERAMLALPQRRPILLTCPDDAGDRALDTLLDRGMKDFSILTTDKIAQRLLPRYGERGLDARENPIILIGGESMRLQSVEAAQLHQCTNSPMDEPIEAAVNALLECVRYGPRPVYLELAGEES